MGYVYANNIFVLSSLCFQSCHHFHLSPPPPHPSLNPHLSTLSTPNMHECMCMNVGNTLTVFSLCPQHMLQVPQVGGQDCLFRRQLLTTRCRETATYNQQKNHKTCSILYIPFLLHCSYLSKKVISCMNNRKIRSQ